ncbi:MAG: A/G-specific adenine glycosylase [Candidimonas sp.]
MTQDLAHAFPDFALRVAQWQNLHGRKHLPWQGSGDPYETWLSEIMLQQTQVSTVIGYYHRFLQRFPTLDSLAEAQQDEVMPYWAGLGYYARARNLHRCAREIIEKWSGRFPPNAELISTLPGIGRSTAAAIAAFCYGERSPIMDGNVKRVFTRYFGIHGVPSAKATENRLWEIAQAVLDAAPRPLDMTAYTQGLMDLGSTLCTRGKPDCAACPLKNGCYAYEHGVQAQLPSPKPRKTTPERHCQMLVLENDGRVLLELQPSPGIWGGLWSLPKFDDAQALAHFCTHWGQAIGAEQRMLGLTHVFSHFKLHIEPWLVRCRTLPLREPEPDLTWFKVQDLDQAALPAPIRKILQGIYADRVQDGDERGQAALQWNDERHADR